MVIYVAIIGLCPVLPQKQTLKIWICVYYK